MPNQWTKLTGIRFRANRRRGGAIAPCRGRNPNPDNIRDNEQNLLVGVAARVRRWGSLGGQSDCPVKRRKHTEIPFRTMNIEEVVE